MRSGETNMRRVPFIHGLRECGVQPVGGYVHVAAVRPCVCSALVWKREKSKKSLSFACLERGCATSPLSMSTTHDVEEGFFSAPEREDLAGTTEVEDLLAIGARSEDTRETIVRRSRMRWIVAGVLAAACALAVVAGVRASKASRDVRGKHPVGDLFAQVTLWK
jgi:hypothetical protein